MTEAEANRGIVLLTEAEAEEKSPFLGKTEAEAEDSVDPTPFGTLFSENGQNRTDKNGQKQT